MDVKEASSPRSPPPRARGPRGSAARGSECSRIHYTCTVDFEAAFTLRGAEGVDWAAERKRQTKKKRKEKEKLRRRRILSALFSSSFHYNVFLHLIIKKGGKKVEADEKRLLARQRLWFRLTSATGDCLVLYLSRSIFWQSDYNFPPKL